MFHSFELEIIRFIHEFRNPLLDGFFKFLDFFDRQEFFFVLIPAVWLGKGWKWGLKLFYVLFLSSFLNNALKEFFLSPRPFHMDLRLGILQVGGYGFPSGAALTVVLVSYLFWRVWNSPWKGPLLFFYITLVSFSRIYLGVHFPTDILGGWVIGLSLGIFFNYLYSRVKAKLIKLKPISLFCLSQFIPLVLLLWQHSLSSVYLCISAMSLGTGLFMNHLWGLSLAPPKNKKEAVLRGIIGIMGTFCCYFFVAKLPQSLHATFWKFILISFWITTGSVLTCRMLISLPRPSLMEQKR